MNEIKTKSSRIDETDQEAFYRIIKDFLPNPPREWRSVWGISKSSGLSQKATDTIFERYKGILFEVNPLTPGGITLYRPTRLALEEYVNLIT